MKYQTMKYILSFITILLFSQVCYARYDAVCYVQYMTKQGWSEKVATEVSFVSGVELTPKQYSNEVYAIVWFSNNNCAIIKLRDNFISTNFMQQDFRSLYWMSKYYDGQQVNSEYERTWRLIAKDEMVFCNIYMIS